MALHGPLVAVTIWDGSLDVSCNANKLDGPHCTVVDLDETVFCSGGAHVRAGGLIDAELMVEGFLESSAATAQDPVMFGEFASNTRVKTVSPTGADGAVAFFFQGGLFDYKFGGQIGAVLPFSAAYKNRNTYGPIRGNVLLPKQTMAATTTGTITNLGATSATQSVYAALHVFSASGSTPTLDVKVQSAALVGFGSPTDRITFTQATTTGDQFATKVAGAITDQFWRVVCTIGGSGPSFSAAVVVGIQ